MTSLRYSLIIYPLLPLLSLPFSASMQAEQEYKKKKGTEYSVSQKVYQNCQCLSVVVLFFVHFGLLLPLNSLCLTHLFFFLKIIQEN